MAHAEPGRNEQARLRPSEDPWNGAQVADVARIVAPRGPRPDLRLLELAHRRGLLEVGDHIGVLEDVAAVVGKSDLRQLVQSGLRLRLEHSGEVALAVAGIGAGKGI